MMLKKSSADARSESLRTPCNGQILLLVAAVLAVVSAPTYAQRPRTTAPRRKVEKTYAEVETKLAPIATKLKKPEPGEWLHEHKEAGQTFAQYLSERPVRRSAKLKKIYLCLLGDFSEKQLEILERTRAYLELFYDTPVSIHKRVTIEDVPERARRVHPTWGDSQILSTWVLNELLKPQVPEDALAYLAFTAFDLWPGDNWNFVYGQANLRDRTGVWSIYRNGIPERDLETYKQCLRRTLHTASHETGHILTMKHCTAYECNLNGVNHQQEADRKPLHCCPVCLRKVCWNLQVSPISYLAKLQKFSEENELDREVEWYAKAVLALRESER